MAKSEKNSFLLYYDYEESVLLLNMEQRGRLFSALFAYEKRGETPDIEDDNMLKMCFSFIKTSLDNNREKYNERCRKNTENGKKGGRPSKTGIAIPASGPDFQPD